MNGYLCKKCGGPAPSGVGYVTEDRDVAETSRRISECACGYSTRVTVLGRTDQGLAVAEVVDVGQFGPYSIRFYLTPCCAADATGVSWGTGIACRACYAELDPTFGLMPSSLSTVFGDGISVAQFSKEAVK